MSKIKLSNKQVHLFDCLGVTIITGGGNTYRYLPFWFKETDQKNVYEVITFEHLPDDVLDDIKTMRENKK